MKALDERLVIAITTGSAILVALIAFAGVSLQNRSHRKDLKLQLEHDAKEKDKDRTVGFRKDIYLRYADESVKAFAFVGSMSTLDIRKVNPALAVKEFTGVASQLMLIADSKSVGVLIKLTSDFSLLLIHLIELLQPISNVQSALDAYDTNIAASLQEQKRVLAEMTYISESGTRDDARFNALQRTFDFHKDQLVILNNQQDVRYKEIEALRKNFNKVMFSAMQSLSDQQLAVISALRSDLNLETSFDVFLDQLKVQRETLMKRASEALKLNE